MAGGDQELLGGLGDDKVRDPVLVLHVDLGIDEGYQG